MHFFRILLAAIFLLGFIFGNCWAQPMPAPPVPGLDWQFVRTDALAAVWYNLEELRQNQPLQELFDADQIAERFRLGIRHEKSLPWKTVTQCYLKPQDTSPTAHPSEEFVDVYTGPDSSTREQLITQLQAQLNKNRRTGDDSGPKIISLRVPELPDEFRMLSLKSVAEIGDEWRRNPVLMNHGENRLVMGGQGETLVRLLAPGTTPAEWTKLLTLQKLNQATIVGALDLSEYRKLNPGQRLNLFRWRYDLQAIYGGLHLVQDKIDQLVWGVSLRDGAQFIAIAQCPSESSASALKLLLEAHHQSLLPAIPNYLNQLSQLPTKRELADALMLDMRQGLKSIDIQQRGNLVRLSFQFPQRVFESIVAIRKDVAEQQESTKNARMIALAMLSYTQAYFQYPPAVKYSKTSAVPVSWRVLILPFLGEKKLYEEYNQNEPWDSEQNKKVLAQMPAVFRSAGAPQDSTNTHYVVLTHSKSLFPLATPTVPAAVPQRMVIDGTSNTLMLVEATDGIPWTQPEDLPIADPPTIPKLGIGPGPMFLAAFGDGTLRRLPREMDDKLFAGILLRNDGSVSNFKEQYPELGQVAAFPILTLRIPQGPPTHQAQPKSATKAGVSAKSPEGVIKKDDGAAEKPQSDNEPRKEPSSQSKQHKIEQANQAIAMLKKMQESQDNRVEKKAP